MNEFTVRLDLAKGKARQQQTVFVRQGDKNATTIVATITDHGAAASTSGMTARFSMRLPNGTEYYRKTATLSGNVATVTIDEAQAASAVGRTDVAYFQLLQGSTVVASTESFTIVVLPDALADAEVADSYDSAIQDAIDALDAAVEQMPDMVEDVLTAHPEWTTTVQDGSITKAKLATDLARDRERLQYRLANMLTNALPEGDVATASDAAKTPVAGLSLYGRSTQAGTPTPSAPVAIASVEGNLAKPYSINSTNRGISYAYDGTGEVAISGTATSWSTATTTAIVNAGGMFTLPAGTYTVVVEVENAASGGVRAQVLMTDDTDVVVTSYVSGSGTASATFTLAEAVEVIARVNVSSGSTVNGTARIALYRGSTAYPYAPYGNVGLWACGKNLFSRVMVGYTMNTSTGEWSASNASNFVSAPIHCTQATLTLLVNSTGGYVGSMFFTCYGADGTYLGQSNGVYFNNITVPYRATINLRSGTVTVRAYGYSSSGATPLLGAEVDVYDGTVSDAYEPYTATVTPIPLDGHELRSLPDGTRDELRVDERGHAVLVQRVGHIEDVSALTFNGFNANSHYITYALTPTGVNTATDKLNVMSDKFVASPSLANGACYVTSDGGLALFCDTSWTAQADAQAALAGVTLDYALATPQTIDLGTIDAVPLVGPDLTAQAIPTAPMQLTYERDLNTTLARLESAIATLA